LSRTTPVLALAAILSLAGVSAGLAGEDGGAHGHIAKPLPAALPYRPVPSKELREELYREFERLGHGRHRHHPCISPSRPDRDCFDHDDDDRDHDHDRDHAGGK